MPLSTPKLKVKVKVKVKESGAMELALTRLRQMVIEGVLLPGEQIRQQEMADLFGVSRVPLREALNVLADQGLLQHRPHAGYFVTKRSPNEVEQIRRMLEFLESDLLGTIAWPTAAELAQLRAMNEQMRQSVARHDWAALFRVNRDFHLQIFELSPDRLVFDEVQRLWTLADPQIARRLSTPEAGARTVAEHEVIIDALASKDRMRCQVAMNTHRNSSAPVPGPLQHDETATQRRSRSSVRR